MSTLTARHAASPAGVPLEDLRFLADLARRMQWDAQMNGDSDGDPRADAVREHIATGTLSALLWLLDVCDVAPASGRHLADRSPAVIAAEVTTAGQRRARELPDSHPWFYLGGVLDGLDFACGARERFWWVPLPEQLRARPVPRDLYGRSS